MPFGIGLGELILLALLVTLIAAAFVGWHGLGRWMARAADGGDPPPRKWWFCWWGVYAWFAIGGVFLELSESEYFSQSAQAVGEVVGILFVLGTLGIIWVAAVAEARYQIRKRRQQR